MRVQDSWRPILNTLDLIACKHFKGAIVSNYLNDANNGEPQTHFFFFCTAAVAFATWGYSQQCVGAKTKYPE
jgi:hypothetical protein